MSAEEPAGYRQAAIENINIAQELIKNSLSASGTEDRAYQAQLAQVHATLAETFAQLENGKRLKHVESLAVTVEDTLKYTKNAVDWQETAKLRRIYNLTP